MDAFNIIEGASMIKPDNRPAGVEKHANRASPVEMHPYPRLRRYFHLKVKRLTTFCASPCSYKMCSLCTPEGEVCSPLTLVLT